MTMLWSMMMPGAFMLTFLADRCSAVCYWHYSVICLSVCLSVVWNSESV